MARLPSLDLPTILEAGYGARSRITREFGPSRIAVKYRLPIERRAVPFEAAARVSDNRKNLQSFPYIDETHRLRVWDADEERPLELLGRGAVAGGLLPAEVRKRCPNLFNWAQQLGYWKDVA